MRDVLVSANATVNVAANSTLLSCSIQIDAAMVSDVGEFQCKCGFVCVCVCEREVGIRVVAL